MNDSHKNGPLPLCFSNRHYISKDAPILHCWLLKGKPISSVCFLTCWPAIMKQNNSLCRALKKTTEGGIKVAIKGHADVVNLTWHHRRWHTCKSADLKKSIMIVASMQGLVSWFKERYRSPFHDPNIILNAFFFENSEGLLLQIQNMLVFSLLQFPSIPLYIIPPIPQKYFSIDLNSWGHSKPKKMKVTESVALK